MEEDFVLFILINTSRAVSRVFRTFKVLGFSMTSNHSDGNNETKGEGQGQCSL